MKVWECDLSGSKYEAQSLNPSTAKETLSGSYSCEFISLTYSMTLR
jgi:hypothetical protein